ncbi:MAG: ATP-binding protein [Rhodobacteraceae bacterium]|nr:ATP-binding protein [Paracoccaceae bacterium]
MSTATTLLQRHTENQVCTALSDTRIVAVVGPRQSGKTTLARKIAAEKGMQYLTLDDSQFREFANSDPIGFVRDLHCAVIDEIQRAPDLFLELKRLVDENSRPGQFLVTGSVDLFRAMVAPDSLAGRVETIKLYPFSQAEIERKEMSSFLSDAFKGDFSTHEEIGYSHDLIARVVKGGFPEALVRANPRRRQAWLQAYADSMAKHDVSTIANLLDSANLARLLDYAAVTCGQTVNLSAFATSLGIDGKTVDRWLTLFEQLFVIRRVSAWHKNEKKRLIKSPKMHFIDSGLLAAIQHVREDDIQKDRSRFGPLLETFVFSELSKLIGHSGSSTEISHFRNRDKVEVDFVLEREGQVVGIEVKATSGVRTDDFRGLRLLKDVSGDDFASGIVLHDGRRIQRISDKLFAMPVSKLWN